ncbi:MULTISPECIES: zinc-binding dehydrogenase [Nocardiaceae]|uniref:zinc-dependent alcohol dehydrogenase n=1 Tax=Nocardiaceae TaxID=85025 RepID=UPI000A787A68|nr:MULTISPECIES: alcohol dehydrogenase catalytic domain-containing protein [Rhodococcus]NIL78463.1 L-threonine 3-dehydrogenase [Rhodococcus sp. B10]
MRQKEESPSCFLTPGPMPVIGVTHTLGGPTPRNERPHNVRAVLKTEPKPGFDLVNDLPDRPLGPDQVRIDVGAVSVCGTDRETYEYGPAVRDLGLRLPVVTGHECAGVVVEIGRDVSALHVGDRVAVETHVACLDCYQCRRGNAHNCLRMDLLGLTIDGAFAERLVVPASTCFRLPDELSLEAAALLEPAGSAMHAVQRSGLDLSGAHVLVSGAGPIGLAALQIALARGANVLVVEPNPHRAAMAAELGGTVVPAGDGLIDRIRDLTGPAEGVDLVLECSGALPALEAGLDAARREGTVVSVGLTARPVELSATRHLISRGLTLKGSFGRRIWDSWTELSALVASGRVDLSRLVSHRMELEDVESAIELLTGDACKVVLYPQGVPQELRSKELTAS